MAFQPCCSQILYPDIRSPGEVKPIWCGIGYILHWVPTCIYIYMGKLERPHCDLTEIMANKGNHHQMALIQAREKIKFTLIYPYIYNYICKIYTRGYIIGMYLTLRPPQWKKNTAHLRGQEKGLGTWLEILACFNHQNPDIWVYCMWEYPTSWQNFVG